MSCRHRNKPEAFGDAQTLNMKSCATSQSQHGGRTTSFASILLQDLQGGSASRPKEKGVDQRSVPDTMQGLKSSLPRCTIAKITMGRQEAIQYHEKDQRCLNTATWKLSDFLRPFPATEIRKGITMALNKKGIDRRSC